MSRALTEGLSGHHGLHDYVEYHHHGRSKLPQGLCHTQGAVLKGHRQRGQSELGQPLWDVALHTTTMKKHHLWSISLQFTCDAHRRRTVSGDERGHHCRADDHHRIAAAIAAVSGGLPTGLYQRVTNGEFKIQS